ncbi:MAG: hypothetical protein IJ297_00595 [Clostridia bacterium]|nr:hypothetical protein [Clostridia bacterium]
MKRIIAIVMVLATVFAFAACGNKTEEVQGDLTVGNTLLKDFEERAENESAIEIAQALVENEVINFMGGAMEVEEGYLTGFGDVEITGFEEGAMFSPMIGTIPFVGYVFTLAEDADKEAFVDTLKANADLRWNICTEAEEMVTGIKENKVFFVMSPMEFEQAEEN